MMKKTAVSKSNSSFQNYTNWLQSGNIPYEVLDWEKNNIDDLKKCSSLLLTGGVDISPEFFNGSLDGQKWDNYIPKRDEFEFKIIDYALENGYPILAICRGMQVMNFKLGGKLIIDIETAKGTNHRKIEDTGVKKDRIHHVNVLQNTLLYDIVGEKEGTINSSHHQAVETPGKGLMISASADDGIVEGIEWAEKKDKPFFLGVQWHPERMDDMNNPFSRKIIEKFKEETSNN